MNYSELLDNVRNYTEVTSDVLSNAVVNVFITNIENQIDRLVDTDAQRRYEAELQRALTEDSQSTSVNIVPRSFYVG